MEIIKKLLTVKSIVTLTLTAIFSILSVRGDISGDQFLTIFTTIIAFYFGVQFEKKNDKKS
jgi:hypothetical protein